MVILAWYNYIAAFFAGAFLANAVPHYVYGICGDRFPSPFSKPPGKGLSSSMVNTVWGLFNAVIGYLLFRAGKIWGGDDLTLVVFFAGVVAMSVMLSKNFAEKHSE